MPILIFFAAMGVAVAAAMAARRSQAQTEVATKKSPALVAGAPSPLLVLDGMLRAGQQPHPQVIMCAIAEAEIMGRMDVVEALVRAFVLPVVQAAQAAQAAQIAEAPPWPGQFAHPSDPYQDSAYPPHLTHPTHPMAQIQPHYPHPDAQPHPDHSPDFDPGHGPGFDPGQGQGGPRPIARPQDVRVELVHPSQVADLSVPQATQGQGQGQGQGRSANTGTITVSGMSSPLDGVPNEAWSDFVARIAREQVTFTSPHHVGQFRQRRSRLAELGIDPGSVVGSPEAQASALCADMGDAYRHAVDSGLVAEYRGVAVEIPASGRADPIEVTLSGVLGVIQAAGLEGAAGWLEDPEDRRRFPHTTQAFLRTNGVF